MLLLVTRKYVGVGESDVEVHLKKTCEGEKVWVSEDLRAGLGKRCLGVANISKRTKALALAAASVDQPSVGPLANADGIIRWITDD